MLSERAIKNFSELYLKQNGVNLSTVEAERLALEFLNFFKLIYRPVPKKDLMLFSRSPMYEL